MFYTILPSQIRTNIYEFDSTYREKYNEIMKEQVLNMNQAYYMSMSKFLKTQKNYQDIVYFKSINKNDYIVNYKNNTTDEYKILDIDE